MKILVIQLSDVHIKGDDDAVTGRFPAIARAVRPLQMQAEFILIAVTGDIAFSGEQSQYATAFSCLADLKAELTREAAWTHGVEIAVIPGNHDCDFTRAGGVREVLLPSALGRSAEQIDPDFARICCEPQRAFFELRDVLDQGSLVVRGDLFHQYEFDTAAGRVAVYCFNTAWLSRLPEQQGALYFPPDLVPTPPADPPIVALSLFHHPFPWLEAQNGRDFRVAVEAISDLLLTGHDHQADRRTQSSGPGEVNEYIEGAVLQDHSDETNSGFNVLLIDTLEKRQRYCAFEWDGERYVCANENTPAEDFQVNKLRDTRSFSLESSFCSYLSDVGIDLRHPSSGIVHLDDIFVYPDLREVKYNTSDLPPVVSSDDILERSLGHQNILVTGPEQSGKTTLAKAAFKMAHAKGFVPILIDGSKFTTFTDDRLFDALYDVFVEQYSARRLDAFKELDRGRRIVVIDRFHAMKFRRRSVTGFLELLSRFAGQVILLANELQHQLQALVEETLLPNTSPVSLKQYRIQAMGFVKRDALAQKWFLLDDAGSEEGLAHRVTSAERLMDAILGKNFVPSYPVFVLAMLQAQTSATTVNLNASTHGYFYELFIRNTLASGLSGVQFDIKMAYLAHLAHGVSALAAGRDGTDFTLDEFEAIHREFETTSALRISFEEARSGLLGCSVLATNGTEYWFKHPYMYYYFVASYLARHISEAATRSTISNLSAHLETEDSANTLLFLAHLSQDPFVVDQVMSKARGLYACEEPPRNGKPP